MFNADTNHTDSNRITPLNWACIEGHCAIVRMLLKEFNVSLNCSDAAGKTPLYWACVKGQFTLVRMFVFEFQADIDCCDNEGKTLLHRACAKKDFRMVRILISDCKANVNCRDYDGKTPLHCACTEGNYDMARMLMSEFEVDVNCMDANGKTPLHCACAQGHRDTARFLLLCFKAEVNHPDSIKGWTALHYACASGHMDVASMLRQDFKADVNVADSSGMMPLHWACGDWHLDSSMVGKLISEFKADVNSKNPLTGWSPLHYACESKSIDLVRTLVAEFKADVNYIDLNGQTPLHHACVEGSVDVTKILTEFNADVSCTDCNGKVPFYYACSNSNFEVVDRLIKACYGDKPPLHIACSHGYLDLIPGLLLHFKTKITDVDGNGCTPLMLAALGGHTKVVKALLCDYKCPANSRDKAGNTVLHYACRGNNLQVLRVLITEHKHDIDSCRNCDSNTPLHVATLEGKLEVVLALINDFNCNFNIRGSLNASLLHIACASGKPEMVKAIGMYILPLTTDDNGDTALHICSALGNGPCVYALLQFSPPLLMRNHSGKTPKDLAIGEAEEILSDYMRENQETVYRHYDEVQKCAKRKYFTAEAITRVFVIGNRGAGKSSLIETLKREGYFDSFWRVSESSVPPHTAGIVPSIYTSQHYGRVLFYDFAGDAEYYSSHAAILENLASSRKGDNIFIIVTDLRESLGKIDCLLHYWASFVQFQKFERKIPFLILIGSHIDLLDRKEAMTKTSALKRFCEEQIGIKHKAACFVLNCCQPKSRQIGEVQKHIVSLIKESPRYKLSSEASVLLGLLEKDFYNVTACSIQTLLSHIIYTGIALPTDVKALYPVLHELHEIGLLFMILNHDKKADLEVVLNTSQLTNKVHQLLFSAEAKDKLREKDIRHNIAFFNVGIIPQSILESTLPKYITKKCLIQLQYCQEICHMEAHAFPSLTHYDSTDKSFLFFPALCCSDRTDGLKAWANASDRSYGIGWLARCTDLFDCFPPRFLHVLILRLVFKFTLSIPNVDSSHFQRRCTMWRTGVHWLMEEGVECLVELVNTSKEVVVLTKSKKEHVENCTNVFNKVVSCVINAKAEFCHSIRLEFFLLDSTDEADFLCADNFFAMNDVERILAHPHGKPVILSVTGKKQMERSKLLCMRKFTHWHNVFPIDFITVAEYLKEVVEDLRYFGLQLDIPSGILNALLRDFPADTARRREEIVREWMSSSQEPPCWWHVVQALRKTDYTVLAEKIRQNNG